jgi:hypothetical protein
MFFAAALYEGKQSADTDEGTQHHTGKTAANLQKGINEKTGRRKFHATALKRLLNSGYATPGLSGECSVFQHFTSRAHKNAALITFAAEF